MRLPLQEQRYLPPCFYEVKCDCPCRSRRFYLLVLRSKMRLPLQEPKVLPPCFYEVKMRLPLQEPKVLPPCFAKQNATALAGAEGFTSLFLRSKNATVPCRSRRFYLLVLRSKMRYYFNVSAFALTSSIVPTLKNAASGYSSISPSSIALKPLTVSSTGTYLPGVPVKFSATWNG